MAITGISPSVLASVVLGIVLLPLIPRFFKPWLRDLTSQRRVCVRKCPSA